MPNERVRPSLPSYIEERIRRPIPQGCGVVEGSTPIIAFGDPSVATVATLGLYPSRQEFLGVDGRLLERDRRFETLGSLGVSDLGPASAGVVVRVWEGCRSYFRQNPYRPWFNQLEVVLQTVGASYYQGSACHLDLVQWATDPTWRGLPSEAIRRHLLQEDVGFLREQLAHAPIKLLLLNGREVVDRFERAFGLRLRIVGPDVTDSGVTARWFVGDAPGGARVVGWSTNLQSSFGVTSVLRRRIAERAGELVR